MALIESVLGAGSGKERTRKTWRERNAVERMGRRVEAVGRLLRMQFKETLATMSYHARQTVEQESDRVIATAQELRERLRRPRVKPPRIETFIPLTGQNLARSIDGKIRTAWDNHVHRPDFSPFLHTCLMT